MCRGRDQNAAARDEARYKHSNRVAAYRNQGNAFYNREVNFKRRSNFIEGTASSRTLSDIRQKIMEKRAAGLKGQETLARAYATKQYVNEGGGSRTAGKNKYLELLGQSASIDNKISQLAGRGESIMQEGWSRKRAHEITKQYTIKGQAPIFGPPTLMPPSKRGNAFMGLLSLGMGIASTGIFGSDKKLKKNIEKVDTSKDGYPIYEFSYLGSNKRYRGVMAQDVVKTNPMAVHIKHGLLYVDYNKIDVDMELVS